jgi:hypothetical protein
MDDRHLNDFVNDLKSNDVLCDDLGAQVEALVQDAPSDDQTRQLVKNVATTLALFAQVHLNASHYYLVQDPSGAWIKNTLSHRTQSNVEKTAIFIFSTLENASKEIDQLQNSQFSPEIIPITELLFRFWTLNLGDLLIVDVHAGPYATQISRSQLSNALKHKSGEKKGRSKTAGKGFGKIC